MKLIENIGSNLLLFFSKVGSTIIFLINTFKQITKKNFPKKELIENILKIGYSSLPVIMVTSFFTGMVLAFQTGTYMESKIKGIARYMGAGIALTMVRELGPVLTSLLIAGRSGSAIAAEIGTMKITEQIDALTVMGINPLQYVVLPKVIAGMISFPLLVIFADLMGIIGGALIATIVVGQPIGIYFSGIRTLIDFSQVFHGLFKSIFFGLSVTFLSCYNGYNVMGGSREVGIATTKAVVSGNMSVFILDYIVTSIAI
ncbi:MAG TPA: ABC transporter permease [Spirochaetota bacterium]|nr:ABC transporter permease [Spirochaetota bacterium]HOM38856.1 ABC transporter permease [Spirochaetota bacterium]HPQ49151.1 ABC transporter permease [Spirochaetota bacterium]